MRFDSESGWAAVGMLGGLGSGGGAGGWSSGACWVLHVENIDYRGRLGSRLNEVADGGKGIVVVLCVVSQEGV